MLAIQFSLKDFLLQKSDLPAGGNYSRYTTTNDPITEIPNDKIPRDDLTTYLKDTGRLDRWTVFYGLYIGNNRWTEGVTDEVVLFQTSAGAKLAISKYSTAITRMTEELNHPDIGYFTRSFYLPGQNIYDWKSYFKYLVLHGLCNAHHLAG